MFLWRLYYHIVWATKERQPLITSYKETELYNDIIGKSNSLNCILHAVGGIEYHIHLVVSIPPTMAIAELNFLRFLKTKETQVQPKSNQVESTITPTVNSIGRSVLEYLKTIGTWEGDDLEECLRLVIASRDQAKFDDNNPFE